MKRRWVRISIAGLLGLCLGWWLAGLSTPMLPGPSAAHAEKKSTGTDHPEAQEHQDDEALESAKTLVPNLGGDKAATPPAYPKFLFWTVVLFVAAAGWGIKRRSPADIAIEADEKASGSDHASAHDSDHNSGHSPDQAEPASS